MQHDWKSIENPQNEDIPGTLVGLECPLTFQWTQQGNRNTLANQLNDPDTWNDPEMEYLVRMYILRRYLHNNWPNIIYWPNIIR